MILDADCSIRSKLLFSELKWIPFPEIVNFHQLSLVFKCINNIYLHNMFRSQYNNHRPTYLLRSSGAGHLDAPRQHTRSLLLIGPKLWSNLNKEIRTLPPYLAFNLSLSISCYAMLNEYYVNSYNIYVCLQQYELSHFYHAYNFKFALLCNYAMFIFIYVFIIMSTFCI